MGLWFDRFRWSTIFFATHLAQQRRRQGVLAIQQLAEHLTPRMSPQIAIPVCKGAIVSWTLHNTVLTLQSLAALTWPCPNAPSECVSYADQHMVVRLKPSVSCARSVSVPACDARASLGAYQSP